MTDSTTDKLHVLVVVLGDLGRSPRMQYHCLSLLQGGHTVTFLGYSGEDLIPALTDRRYSQQFRSIRFTAPKLYQLKDYALPLYFIWRIVSLTVLLIAALLQVTKTTTTSTTRQKKNPDLILVQNPPAVPLLAVAALYGRLMGAALVIDWHNLGYSMIAGNGVWMRSLARMYEEWWAPYANGHLTVTKALRDYLISDMGIISNTRANSTPTNMSVLHDCPPPIFRLRTVKEQHTVLKQLNLIPPASWSESLPVNNDTLTLFTEEYAPGRFRPRANRPALIVSSTSWTRDEDIGLLIDACVLADQMIERNKKSSNLKIVCCITGKGPLQEIYEHEIAVRCSQLSHVMVTTLWIPPADYPIWVGCADLGISLHTSTSGMDLPIKILDYFGCEVPVCAYQFSCLRELVQDDVNGRTFTTAEQLSSILLDLLQPLAMPVTTGTDDMHIGNHDFGELKRYSLQVQGRLLWSENWPKNAWPVLAAAVSKNRRMLEQQRLHQQQQSSPGENKASKTD